MPSALKGSSEKRQFGSVICRRRDLISTLTCVSNGRCRQPRRRPKHASFQKMSKGMREDAIPPLDGGQLLRTCRQATQEAGNARQNIGRPMRIGVGTGNAQGRLASVTKALGDTGQEQRPAGDRLEMPSGLGEPHKEIPPIVDQGDETGRKPATGQIVRREPAPAPLVLQFIEGILAIRPVAIELAKSEKLSFE